MTDMNLEERCERLEVSIGAQRMLIASALALCASGAPDPVAALDVLGRTLIDATMKRLDDALVDAPHKRNLVIAEFAEEISCAIGMGKDMARAYGAQTDA